MAMEFKVVTCDIGQPFLSHLAALSQAISSLEILSSAQTGWELLAHSTARPLPEYLLSP